MTEAPDQEPDNGYQPKGMPRQPRHLPRVHKQDKKRIFSELMPGVSRAFYLTLRVLPEKLQEPIGLAYLLARAADTIADTAIIPTDQRLRYLLAFRGQVEGPIQVAVLYEIEDALRDRQALPAEQELLKALPSLFVMLEALEEEDRARVRKVVITLTLGMEIDLKTFPAEDSKEIGALQSAEELDRYIYYVAGCVGEFWTQITSAHFQELGDWDVEEQSKFGVRFGKALQLTNVLRDVPKDLRIGRCYLPEAELAKQGLKPSDLMNEENREKAQPVLSVWLRAAIAHFDCAEAYTLAIPRKCLRLRLAVLWPILIGLATLAKTANNEKWLSPECPSKVTRGWVYRMMLLSIPTAWCNWIVRWWIRRLRTSVERALLS